MQRTFAQLLQRDPWPLCAMSSQDGSTLPKYALPAVDRRLTRRVARWPREEGRVATGPIFVSRLAENWMRTRRGGRGEKFVYDSDSAGRELELPNNDEVTIAA